MELRIETFRGAEILPYLEIFSQMRLKNFCHFPYLYAGNLKDDLIYTRQYSAVSKGMLIAAFNGENIIGIRSGIPLLSHTLISKQKCQQLEAQGLDIKEYYYCGEIIVDPAFRKMGIGNQLMKKFIGEVETMKYSGLMAVTSIRPANHPLRPQKYFDTGIFLGKFGFKKSPVVFSAQWPTHQAGGDIKEQMNKLACWVKTF